MSNFFLQDSNNEKYDIVITPDEGSSRDWWDLC
jgi:hypothetical protein